MKQHPLGRFGVFDLTGFPKVLEMEQKYLSPEELQRDEQSIGVYDPKPAGALPANQSPSRTGSPQG
jgi:2,3-dimethylmalate lyase